MITLVIQTSKMYFSLQGFWQTKYLITKQLCTFCGFGGKNFAFETLCEAVLISAKSMMVSIIHNHQQKVFASYVNQSAFIYYTMKFNLYTKCIF